MAEKTEQPTPKRIRDARKKGQVPKSREFVSTVVFLFVVLFLLYGTDTYMPQIHEMFLLVIRSFHVDVLDGSVMAIVYRLIMIGASVIAPVLFIVIFASLFANLCHTGFIFCPYAIKPNLENFSLKKGFKRLFSKDNVLDLLKSGIKITVIGVAVYSTLKSSLPSMVYAPSCGFYCSMNVLENNIRNLVKYSCVVFVVFAIFDLVWQRFQYIKKLKMSKEEVIREFKETEGDPFIKGRRHQLHQELNFYSAQQGTKEATMVVTNPVHLAVAIRYVSGETRLPIITAKGRGYLSKVIIDTARELNIPIMQNIPLAHALNDKCEIGKYIPRDLIKPVAEVIRWLYSQKMKRNFQ